MAVDGFRALAAEGRLQATCAVGNRLGLSMEHSLSPTGTRFNHRNLRNLV